MSYAVTKVGRTFVARWEAMTAADIARLKHELESFERACRKQVVYVSVTHPGSKPPDDEARAAMVAAAESLMPKLVHLYVVIEMGSFMGSVHRSALAGMLLMSKLRKKVKVVRSLDEVLQAGSKVLGVEPHVARARLTSDGMMVAS